VLEALEVENLIEAASDRQLQPQPKRVLPQASSRRLRATQSANPNGCNDTDWCRQPPAHYSAQNNKLTAKPASLSVDSIPTVRCTVLAFFGSRPVLNVATSSSIHSKRSPQTQVRTRRQGLKRLLYPSLRSADTDAAS
jgi:hypothetical protein